MRLSAEPSICSLGRSISISNRQGLRRGCDARRRCGSSHLGRADRCRCGIPYHDIRFTDAGSAVEACFPAAAGQADFTSTALDEVCISVFTSEPVLPMARLIDLFPGIFNSLKNAPATSTVRGAICGSSKLRSVTRERVALIGDASGSVDALTGEGMSLAFRQAFALAEAFGKKEDRPSAIPSHSQTNRPNTGADGQTNALCWHSCLAAPPRPARADFSVAGV
jgi:hypothetical protein